MSSILENIPFRTILLVIAFAIVLGYIVNMFMTIPRYSRSAGEEGFFGGVARGSGHPDCLRILPEGSRILDGVSRAARSDDYRELELLLSKMACLKKDLMNPSGIVEATRYQQFEPAHDREPVAEVAATCLNQSIPKRDLDIIFSTWRDRGDFLLRKLCTEANLKEGEVKGLEDLLNKGWMDVYDVAKSRCIKTADEGAGSPGDVAAFDDSGTENARAYDGYFSGWGGQI